MEETLQPGLLSPQTSMGVGTLGGRTETGQGEGRQEGFTSPKDPEDSGPTVTSPGAVCPSRLSITVWTLKTQVHPPGGRGTSLALVQRTAVGREGEGTSLDALRSTREPLLDQSPASPTAGEASAVLPPPPPLLPRPPEPLNLCLHLMICGHTVFYNQLLSCRAAPPPPIPGTAIAPSVLRAFHGHHQPGNP